MPSAQIRQKNKVKILIEREPTDQTVKKGGRKW